ncbi:MAG: hypothetical protein JNN06_01365 [Gemmobacter sp.]|uniref:hypothetical protein n=1 Tax=Gemmobacter sp. TaxID=1898957 RepID=UPI001A4BDC22|nr:hypothetical protein [Gemmobacter sp.]MBL8560903.1 hypothetical protein [Gemmobacter sp.]
MTLMRAAMRTLTGALSDLQAAVAAETARQDRVQRGAALNAFVGTLTANKAGAHFVDDTDLAQMAGLVGMDTTGLSADQIRRRLVNYSASDALKGTVYDPTGNREKAYLDSLLPRAEEAITDPLLGYRLGYGWRGSQSGEWHQIVHGPLGGARTFNVPEGQNKSDWLKKMVEEKKLPAFAAGGFHGGGLRMVGEGGIELEATGPARYYSARKTQEMLGGANDALIARVDAMASEIAAMRAEQRQLGQGTYDETRKISNRVTKWDASGLPPERV